MGLVFGAFGLSYALFEIPMGLVGDRYGVKKILTRLVLTRGAVGAGFIAGISAAAQSALKEGDALADFGQIGKQSAIFVIGQYLRADGHFDHQIFAACAIAVTSGTAAAARGLEMLGVTEIDQRVETGNRFKQDVATASAIAAVWAAIFDIFFAAKTDSSGATGAGTDVDFRLIKEMHRPPLGELYGFYQSRPD
jgi:MFS family permease